MSLTAVSIPLKVPVLRSHTIRMMLRDTIVEYHSLRSCSLLPARCGPDRQGMWCAFLPQHTSHPTWLAARPAACVVCGCEAGQDREDAEV